MKLYRNFKNIYINITKSRSEIEKYATSEYFKEYIEKFGSILSVPSIARNDKTLLVYANHIDSYALSIECILAKKIQIEYGWRIIFLCNLNTIDLAKKICNQVYRFNEFHLIEDYMELFSFEHKDYFKKIDNAVSLKEIKDILHGEIPIGLHAISSYSNTLPSASIDLSYSSRRGIKKYLKKSLNYLKASKKIIDEFKPSVVLSLEKGSVGTCEIFYETLNHNIPFIQYFGCHEPNSIIIKRYNRSNKRDHTFSVSEKTWQETEYKNDMERIVMESFKNGYQNGDWFKYKNLTTNKKILSKDQLIYDLRLDPRKKNAIIFSHILNDANFFYGKDLFEGGFREWLVKTVEVAVKNHHVNWLVKLHPANIYRRSKQGYTGEFGEILAIKEFFGYVPDNLKIIPADIDINPYSFFNLADYGITVRGTIGAELPCFGIPVLVAGTGRYSGKGFTIDSNNKEDYLDLISNIHKIPRLNEEQKRKALKHAFLFFKERPANYADFLKDCYPCDRYQSISRNIEPVISDIWSHRVLINIVNFLVCSSDEDFLMKKIYGVSNEG